MKNINPDTQSTHRVDSKHKGPTNLFRLMFSVALKYKELGVPLEDLVQEGSMGLMKAAKRFDYTKGFKFSTYAIWWVR